MSTIRELSAKETLSVSGGHKHPPPAPDSEQVDAWIIINTRVNIAFFDSEEKL